MNLLDQLYDLSVTAGMNQRYHQAEADRWAWWVTAIAVSTAVAAVLTMVLSVAAYYRPQLRWWKWAKLKMLEKGISVNRLAFWSSVASVAIATALNVAPANTKAQFYADMFRRWSDLRIDVDSLETDVRQAEQTGQAIPDYYVQRYRDLVIRKNALNALEPRQDEALLLKMLEEEERTRGASESPPKVARGAASPSSS